MEPPGKESSCQPTKRASQPITAILLAIGFVGFKYLTQPKDLGIKRDSSLVAAFKQRNNMSITPTHKRIELNTDMTSEEVTAVFTLWQEKDNNFPK